jgi:hypothetical protein
MDRGLYFILRNLNRNFRNLNRNQRAMFLWKGFPESKCTSLPYWERFLDPEPGIHRRAESPPSDFSAWVCGKVTTFPQSDAIWSKARGERGVAELRTELIGWL